MENMDGVMDSAIRVPMLAREDLLAIDNMLSVPTIILNDELVLFTNQAFKHALGYTTHDVVAYHDFALILQDKDRRIDEIRRAIRGEIRPEEIVSRGRTQLRKGNGEPGWFDYYGKVVQFYDSKYIMLNLIECTDHVLYEQGLERKLTIAEKTVEYYQSIQRAENIREAYRIALHFASWMIPAAEFGSVLVRDGNYFVPLLSVGYDEYTLSKFRLHADELFIVKSDGHHVNYTVKYDDLHLFREFYQVVRQDGDVMTIRSLLTSPIRQHGELVAAFSVDTSVPSAFTDSDIQVMEMIRKSLQTAANSFGKYR